MRLTFPDWLTETAQAEWLTDPYEQDLLPIALWIPLLQLSREQPPQAALVRCRSRDGACEWTVSWLGGGELIYLRATSNQPRWTGYQRDEAAAEIETLEAWARPLRDILRLEIVDLDVRVPEGHYDSVWDWTASICVVFGDGVSVTYEEMPEASRGRDRRAEFLDALHTARTNGS